MSEMSMKCPACCHSVTDVSERIGLEFLASAWSRNWPIQPAPKVDTIRDWMVADLGTVEIAFRRCQKCGLEFNDPPRSWTAGHYPAQSHGLGFDQLQALRSLQNQPAATVLEIGCGCGEFLASAASMGHKCLGIDFSADSVAKAQSQGVDARVMDLTELSRLVDRPSLFDVVAMFQVIEHLENPDELFRQITSLAKSHTTLFIGCPNPDRFSRRLKHADRIGSSDFWDFPPQHLLRWTPHSLKAFLSRHGWHVTRVEYEPFNTSAAAAQLVAIDGLAGGWYANPLRRRLATLARWIQLSSLSLMQSYSGTRLFVEAVLAG